MGYVDDTLGSGERIVRKAEFHWLYTAQAAAVLVVMLAIGGAVYLVGQGLRDAPQAEALTDFIDKAAIFIAGGLALIGLFAFLREMLATCTTEIAVTDRRLIYKTGFIARRTQELPVSKLEEVNLKQGVLGRALGYGRLTIAGTGGDKALTLPDIDDPVAFRRAIAEARSGAPEASEG